MHNLIIILILLPFVCSCQPSQPQYLNYTNPYNLEKLDLELDVAKFYSKAEDEDIFVMVDQQESPMWREPKTILGSSYNQRSWVSDKFVGEYANLRFQRMNMFTDTTGRLMSISATNQKVKAEEIDKLREQLNEKFGKEIRSRGLLFGKWDILSWDAGDRVIRMSLMQKDPTTEYGASILTLDNDGKFDTNLLDGGEIDLLYFSIIRKDGGVELVEDISSGEFLNSRGGIR